ncbi:phage tail protein [Herbaspirillum seropedicae]|uniref:phage tail protein n=1 Tax=Herbaspirillum seropedicae TaxID=964 RepID=UPI003FCEA01F
MATETFTWATTASLTKQVKFGVWSVQFDDGYEQTVRKGLNPVTATWNVSVTGSTETIAAVEDFLDRHGGDVAFYWVAPRDGLVLVRATADGYSTSESGGGVSTVTVAFKRVYVP